MLVAYAQAAESSRKVGDSYMRRSGAKGLKCLTEASFTRKCSSMSYFLQYLWKHRFWKQNVTSISGLGVSVNVSLNLIQDLATCAGKGILP